MSRCEEWLAATMKFVCCGMWLAPFTCVSQHPLVEQRAAPSARPRLPARRHGVAGRGSPRRRRPAPARPRARAPRPPARARSSSCSSATVPSVVTSTLSGSATPRVLERARQLRVHQAVEAQLAEPAARAAPRRAAGPTPSRPCPAARRPGRPRPHADRQRALGLLVLAADARDLGGDLAALDRALGGLGQIAVPEVQRLAPASRAAGRPTPCGSAPRRACAPRRRTAPCRARGRRPPRTPPARRCRRAGRRPTAP